jgi:hypothetical protein
MRRLFGTCRDHFSSFSVLVRSTTLVFARCVHVRVRSQISFVRSHFVVVRRVNSFGRCVDSFVGRAYFVRRCVDFFVRAEHAIAGRDHFFNGSLDLSGRRVIFSGRRGESFPRRDTDFRRRADFVVAHEYFFGTGDGFFFASSRFRDSGACAATAVGTIAPVSTRRFTGGTRWLRTDVKLARVLG